MKALNHAETTWINFIKNVCINENRLHSSYKDFFFLKYVAMLLL